MARAAKQEKALTPEEKLARALVPMEEQPYAVPGNWCWTKLGSLSAHISDGSHNPPKDAGAGIPLLSAANIHDRFIDFENTTRWITHEEWVTENERTRIEKGDILLTIVASIGRVAVVNTNRPFALQRSVATIKPMINTNYLSYFLESPYIQGFMNTNAKGTAQKGFYLNSVESLYCAVAPLAEQQRIVDRIERLFAKLDEAKEKAQAVVDGFEDRKAAILHKAISGELTASWRHNKGYDIKSWQYQKLSDFASVKGGKRLPKGCALTREKTRHPYLRIADFGDNTIDMSDIHYITDDVYEQISRYTIRCEDVYISIVGTIGKCGIIPEELDGANLTENAARIISNRTIPLYLVAFLNSPSAQREIKDRIRSATLGKLSLTNIGKIVVPIPTMEEQRVIIDALDTVLTREQQARESAEAVLSQIDTMKKAIFARAFRGELGTNDPADESAEEMLKRLL